MFLSKTKVILFLFLKLHHCPSPGGEGRSPQKSISKERRGPSTVCKPCNLVFENQRWLDTHTKSGDHSHVVKVIPIQHTEDTKDVPSGKREWHRPVALEYARHWNMRQPGSGTSWHQFMQCRSLDTTVGKSQSKERHCIKWGHRPVPLPAAA